MSVHMFVMWGREREGELLRILPGHCKSKAANNHCDRSRTCERLKCRLYQCTAQVHTLIHRVRPTRSTLMKSTPTKSTPTKSTPNRSTPIKSISHKINCNIIIKFQPKGSKGTRYFLYMVVATATILYPGKGLCVNVILGLPWVQETHEIVWLHVGRFATNLLPAFQLVWAGCWIMSSEFTEVQFQFLPWITVVQDNPGLNPTLLPTNLPYKVCCYSTASMRCDLLWCDIMVASRDKWDGFLDAS